MELPFQSHYGAIATDYSFTQDFHFAPFQSHYGAIATRDFGSSGRHLPESFNPTMVRLRRKVKPSEGACRRFQSHYGAIATGGGKSRAKSA